MRNRKIAVCLILVLLLVLSVPSYAAPKGHRVFDTEISWQQMIGGERYDQFTCIQQTSDGGYIVGGYTAVLYYRSTNTNYIIDKLDSAGGLEWEQLITCGEEDVLVDIQQTADDGYIIAARSYSLETGRSDYYIVKLDRTGNLEWEKMIGGSSDEVLIGINQTIDGGYVIGGYSSSTDINGTTNHGLCDYYIVKLDYAGNQEWDQKIGTSTNDVLMCIQPTADGGSIFSGRLLPMENDASCLYVFKLDSAGNIEWEQAIERNGHAYYASIEQTMDSGYIMGGTICSRDTIDSDYDYNYDVIKLDSAGNLEWEHIIGGSENEYFVDLKKTMDGGYVLGGKTYSTESNSYDYHIVRLDNKGNITWEQKIGDSNHYTLKCIQLTADGGYIIGGHIRDIFYDEFLNVVKLDSAGNLEWEQTIGGSHIEVFGSIQQTRDGGYIIAGSTISPEINGVTNHGCSDIYIAKLELLRARNVK